jgi:hypothetical protein
VYLVEVVDVVKVAAAFSTDVLKVNVLPVLIVVQEVFACAAVAPTTDSSTAVLFAVF